MKDIVQMQSCIKAPNIITAFLAISSGFLLLILFQNCSLPAGFQPSIVPEQQSSSQDREHSCLLGKQIVKSGQSIGLFKTRTVPQGSTCRGEIRVCQNGILSGSATYASCSVAAVTNLSPFQLFAGDKITWGNIELLMQADGNLVLYRDPASPWRTVLWSSQTSKNNCLNSCLANFRIDGNLELSQNGAVYWSSQTAGHPGAQLALSSRPPYLSVRSNDKMLYAGGSGQQLNWFSELYQMDSHGSGVQDFMMLFNSTQPVRAMSKINVLKLYTQTIIYASDSDLRTIFKYLKQNNISLAIEFEPVTASTNCGVGISSYAGQNIPKVPTNGPELAIMVARKIQALGGDLAYVAMDEPMMYAHYNTSGNTPPNVSCQFSINDLAKNVAKTYVAFQSIFPSVAMGDVEPYFMYPSTTWLNDNNLWLDAWFSATGVPLAFFHDDGYVSDLHWQQSHSQILPFLKMKNIPYGLIRDSNGIFDVTSDADWIRAATANIKTYESLGFESPPQNIFQSWDPYPSLVSPETSPTTLTYLVDNFFP